MVIKKKNKIRNLTSSGGKDTLLRKKMFQNLSFWLQKVNTACTQSAIKIFFFFLDECAFISRFQQRCVHIFSINP